MIKKTKKSRVRFARYSKVQLLLIAFVVLTFGGIAAYYLARSHALISTAVPGLTESFTGNQVTNKWITNGSWSQANGKPQVCLTAGNGGGNGTDGTIPKCTVQTDSSGHGALRLTDSNPNESGIVVNETPIKLNAGYHITFDMYQYGYQYAGRTDCPVGGYNGTCVGADGISFFLIDGSKDPASFNLGAAVGGEMGYIEQNGGPGGDGIHGGYVGIGFDEYGNFSYPPAPNSIVVRGSEASDYAYVEGRQEDGTHPIATDSDKSRSGSNVRHVEIDISSAHHMAVLVTYGNGPTYLEIPDLDLSSVNGSQTMPDSMYLGFGAATGGSFNIHEINNLAVSQLTPDNGGGLVGQDKPGPSKTPGPTGTTGTGPSAGTNWGGSHAPSPTPSTGLKGNTTPSPTPSPSSGSSNSPSKSTGPSPSSASAPSPTSSPSPTSGAITTGSSANGNTISPSPGPLQQPNPSQTPTTDSNGAPIPKPTEKQNLPPADAPIATASPKPSDKQAPKPEAQGSVIKPQPPQISPFYDGKQYAKGSVADNYSSAAARRPIVPGLIAAAIALPLTAGAAYLYWRRRPVKTRPVKRGRAKSR